MRDHQATGGRPRSSVRARRCGTVATLTACLRMRGWRPAAAPAPGGLPPIGRGQAASRSRRAAPPSPAAAGGRPHAASRTPAAHRDPCAESARAGTARRARRARRERAAPIRGGRRSALRGRAAQLAAAIRKLAQVAGDCTRDPVRADLLGCQALGFFEAAQRLADLPSHGMRLGEVQVVSGLSLG
jgi:hypothetical protein